MAGTDGERVALVWDESMAGYDFGGNHPLDPLRVELTVALIRSVGVLDQPHVDLVRPGAFDEVEVLRVHRPEFMRAVKRLSKDPAAGVDASFGLGPGDTPAFAGMHEASMLVASASREAARMVLEGEAIHAFSPGGGLHHAMPDRASGFCVYNDPAIAIDWLLEHGAERVAYVDVDVHHGDGVELMFADEPRVLTISLHESGRFLFPGTGHVDDIGGPDARGHAANVPLLPGTDGPLWLDTFDRVVPPLLESFAPDVLVTQLGADTHVEDPLAHLALRVDDQTAAVRRLHQLAHEVAGGRWVATGGGGYSLIRVVPRTWAAAFAEMAGHPLPDAIPEDWQRLAASKQRGEPPTSFSDPMVEVDPAARGRALEAAREAAAAVKDLVLPHHRAR